jgi:two-component system sensor histidine kinase UhpB
MVPTQKELSLEDALNELITTYAEFETMQFHLKSHACIKKIDEEMKLMFYRIIQEQLNNIVKHARCKNVWIEFAYARNNIRLKIRDDGKGFNLLRKNSGIGLSNIRVRLELYKGTMHIETAPNKGCAINISVPKIISLRGRKNPGAVTGP